MEEGVCQCAEGRDESQQREGNKRTCLESPVGGVGVSGKCGEGGAKQGQRQNLNERSLKGVRSRIVRDVKTPDAIGKVFRINLLSECTKNPCRYTHLPILF